MSLAFLALIPLGGTISIASLDTKHLHSRYYSKLIALMTTIANLILSLIIFIFFNNSTNQFQYVQEHYNMQLFDIYLGIDGISIFFILLTTIIMPIAILSNWKI